MKTDKSKKRSGSVTIGQQTYSYALRRSKKAKNILIHVDIDGTIEVVVPWRVALWQAERFVAERTEWIERVLRKHEGLQQQVPRRQWRTGEELPFFGERYRLAVHIEPRRKRSFVQDDNQLLTVRVAAPEHVKAAVAKWYRAKSRDYFVGQSIAFADLLGKRVAAVRVRDTKSQWGSCNRKKAILTYGWRLALAPEPVARYVVVHEVAHLQYSNHGERFWQTVEKLYPGYQTPRRWLRTHGYTLVL